MQRTEIFSTVSCEGFHCWPAAPQEVEFLRSLHRHIFYVKAFSEVIHGDREIEFILFKRDLEDVVCSVVQSFLKDNPTLSCEQLGWKISEGMAVMKERRLSRIEVSEDNENGAALDFRQSRNL